MIADLDIHIEPHTDILNHLYDHVPISRIKFIIIIILLLGVQTPTPNSNMCKTLSIHSHAHNIHAKYDYLKKVHFNVCLSPRDNPKKFP